MKTSNKYIVILPENLPVDGRGDRDLHGAYAQLAKRAVTEAASEREAVTHVVFRGCTNRKLATIISSYLLDYGQCEVYEVPEVANEDGSSMSQSEKRQAEEIFVADAIARRRGIDEFYALKISRKLLETLAS